MRVPANLVLLKGTSSWLVGSCLLAVSSHDRARKLWCLFLFFVRAIIPTLGPSLITSFKHNYLPKALLPNTITSEVRASVYQLREDTNIESVTVALPFCIPTRNEWEFLLLHILPSVSGVTVLYFNHSNRHVLVSCFDLQCTNDL